jgi:DnaJ-domain-containing protein 1
MPHTLEQLEVEKKRRALIAEKERRQQFGTATLEPPAQIDMQIADPNDAYIGMSDPNEIRKRAKEVFDISIELETPPEEIEINYENLTKKAQKLIPGTMRFGAGEPMTIRAAPERTKWQKFKNFFVSERRPLPPDADRMEKVSRAFDIAVGSPLRVFLKFGKGMTLNTPDLMWAAIKRITPEDMWDDEVKNMTLDEAMDWAGGYDPSGFQKTVGEMAEFIGRLKTVAPIAQRLGIIGNTPKDISVLDKAFETAKLFGTSAIAEQIAKGASDVIDPTEAEFGFEGPKAVLRDMAIGAIFSFIHSGAKGLWSKLTPSEHSRALKMLGLKKGATQEEITRAANNFARKYHPDKAKGYVDEFKKVIKARDLLRQGEAQDIVYRGQKVTIKPKALTGKVGAEKAAGYSLQRAESNY